MNTTRSGFAHMILLILIVLGALAVVGYFAMKGNFKMDNYLDTKTTTVTPTLSPSTDVDTIQKEFDETTVESTDAEFTSLSAEVKAL